MTLEEERKRRMETRNEKWKKSQFIPKLFIHTSIVSFLPVALPCHFCLLFHFSLLSFTAVGIVEFTSLRVQEEVKGLPYVIT